ncbi:cell division protein FtsL [Salinisphaera sp. Q1T1-3]|uniref:cell division protein FtsL n=1 Tax=Salinisphaera sp. Q1T1-3 TaxID=2321229 RepID=UPI000E711740|nr:cell division protein FtsL [Salinisphaera sp. Q1T1-3]RJS92231.1 cell division protein FtsL [Salinisphaera sp. Q1T1-3]
MSRRTLIITALLVLNIASAIGVVESKQKTRELFHQLQVERVTRDRLATEWAQIQLEDSAWASPDRVSQVARTRLGMIQPRDYVVLGDQ